MLHGSKQKIQRDVAYSRLKMWAPGTAPAVRSFGVTSSGWNATHLWRAVATHSGRGVQSGACKSKSSSATVKKNRYKRGDNAVDSDELRNSDRPAETFDYASAVASG